MFIIDSFLTLISSYQFYFSSFMFIGLGIITTVGRVSQVLLKEKFSKLSYLITELCVEGLRLLQYVFFILIGRNIIFNFNIIWQSITQGFLEINYPQIIWDLLGFLIVFGLYNFLIFILFSKNNISKIMKRFNIERYSIKSFQLALVLGFKNLFLIPISVIYLLIIFKIIL
ncbi:hypothetical protein D3H55_15110 [Bacillus salacetis]|uniref:Uncharacterized protein n=1 Tax=Bacillus salacetis TaxID=2315464 RepID=A0A3A1QX82_9BACI|nr:hypothetical protein D3H55_15110 [Bacillus salacetis]